MKVKLFGVVELKRWIICNFLLFSWSCMPHAVFFRNDRYFPTPLSWLRSISWVSFRSVALKLFAGISSRMKYWSTNRQSTQSLTDNIQVFCLAQRSPIAYLSSPIHTAQSLGSHVAFFTCWLMLMVRATLMLADLPRQPAIPAGLKPVSLCQCAQPGWRGS